ncbi:MAG: hypothetical protein WC108_05875 [Bacteroidales bacterium]|jgi:hypothetical protein|nr:hypothetical protein [Bacteroidales bacterium]MDD4002348.1 hypothetical protein [Bacteroidales bacterium]MDD4529685.1 hypothetical protein [Bacteroidales bacterium]MDD4830265.1 hypothetical protein [Bacteroidales bacterium]
MIWTVVILAIAFVAAVFAIGYFNNQSIKQFVVNEQKKSLLEIKKIQETETRKVVTPIQLQAYERLVLFLERMNPDNLVLRCFQPNMDSKLLKDVMVKNIRDEFEHNLSQQLYISNQAWALIKNAKEEMISLINSVQAKEDDKITATKFAGNLFEQFAGKKNPLEQAMDVLKEEIQSRFA